MHLVKATSTHKYSVTVRCVICGKLFLSGDGWADADGVPFMDYYCAACAEEKVTNG